MENQNYEYEINNLIARSLADLFIHPDDLEYMVKNYNKDEMLVTLSENNVFTCIFR